MLRKLAPIVAILLAIAAAGVATALGDGGPTTGTNVACATVTDDGHVLSVDGTSVYSIAAQSTSSCNTVTYTVPTSTSTETDTTTSVSTVTNTSTVTSTVTSNPTTSSSTTSTTSSSPTSTSTSTTTSSSSTSSGGAGSSFCTISQAYTNLTTGPHLCGWPDSTTAGYQNAPGYPGSLTAAPTTACPSQGNLKSNTTYSFCKWTGLSMPANLTNVVFYGDDFQVTAPQNANVTGGNGDTGITFEYDTFQPNVSAPPVSCSQSYQYGIYNEGGQMKGYTVEYSNFWGFGNAIDTSGSTQAAPQVFRGNWIHDSVTTGGCGYHNDGIGMLNGGTEDYAVVDDNTIESVGNTNGIAWQNGTYAHDSDTNNLLSGWNEPLAGGRCTSSCTAPSYITVTGNTLSTYLADTSNGSYPIDNATNFWSGTGDTWKGNYWAVPPGSFWGTAAYNGYFWVPTTNSGIPNDCGFVSQTDWPNVKNPC